jgi:hypothetical protein
MHCYWHLSDAIEMANFFSPKGREIFALYIFPHLCRDYFDAPNQTFRKKTYLAIIRRILRLVHGDLLYTYVEKCPNLTF